MVYSRALSPFPDCACAGLAQHGREEGEGGGGGGGGGGTTWAVQFQV